MRLPHITATTGKSISTEVDNNTPDLKTGSMTSNLIKSVVSKYVESGITEVVYHMTSIGNGLSILQDDRFKLSGRLGGKYDSRLPKPGKFYFLSTARSLSSAFIKDGASYGDVIFVLDGGKLSRKYSGKAFEYYPPNERHRGVEMEDRVYHTEPYITGATQYIKEVYALAEDPDKISFYLLKWLDRFCLEAESKNIPVYIFNDKNSFHKSRGLTVKEYFKTVDRRLIRITESSPDYKSKEYALDDIAEAQALVGLSKKTSVDNLTNREHSLLNTYRNYGTLHIVDVIELVLKNYRLHPNVVQPIYRLWRDLGIETPNQFSDYLTDKWTNLGFFD